jgi:hypothetical protein
MNTVYTRPYDKYHNLKLWKVLEKSIKDLVKNQDLQETTDRYYIIGYLIKNIDKHGLLKEE